MEVERVDKSEEIPINDGFFLEHFRHLLGFPILKCTLMSLQLSFLGGVPKIV